MKHVRVLFCLAAVGALAGCGSMDIGGDSAVAKLDAKSGTATQGTVTFTQRGDRVLVKADVSGLPPNTEHGFHVHEKGDCSSPDAMSAGGHFNPTGKPHGSMSMPDHHAGDINNLRADASGRAQASFQLTGVTVAPGPTSVVGRAVVVHKDPDDYRTQPTGNSGGRVACGVIAKS
ncbi:superoxide dismutase family protein [Cupriavidus sp. WS]|uniref:superoxide dismutase family protein n=1 Tax=Cupriavidus sp. WS TaxID=1312922 RepID=UPI000399E9E1|nr:superoxide dismutase family protein [Cupriavidus sp. WS]